jgi:hypothetical protein
MLFNIQSLFQYLWRILCMVIAHREYLAISREFLVVTTGKRNDVSGWRLGNGAKHPTMFTTLPHYPVLSGPR